MTEDKSFNSDYELIQFNDEIKNENNTQDIFKSCEEVMKEYKRYGEIIKSEKNLNVQELKQNYQKMIGEIKSENDKQISILKEIIEQKDEKIISFENKIKKV
uniref:TACC_C domain-containing protein n=1 Tax=Meloidogyne hapla TaxID=6305 RepID=A0A1I8BCF5_MELHA